MKQVKITSESGVAPFSPAGATKVGGKGSEFWDGLLEKGGPVPARKTWQEPIIRKPRLPKEELAALSDYFRKFKMPDNPLFDESRFMNNILGNMMRLHPDDALEAVVCCINCREPDMARHAIWHATSLPGETQLKLIEYLFRLDDALNGWRDHWAFLALGILVPKQPESEQKALYPEIRELMKRVEKKMCDDAPTRGYWECYGTASREYGFRTAYGMPEGELGCFERVLVSWSEWALTEGPYAEAHEAVGNMFKNPRESWQALFKAAMKRRGPPGFGASEIAHMAIGKVGTLAAKDRNGLLGLAVLYAPFTAKPKAIGYLAASIAESLAKNIGLTGNGNA